MTAFNELGLSKAVVRAIGHMGFEETTPIQEQTIPLVMDGRDIIGQAQTGTGKTAAFGIPLIEKMEAHTGRLTGLVVTPTRELAIQVAEELNKIGQFSDVRTLPIYGGQDIARQIRALKARPQIIAGTPGRLLDHLRRKTIRLQDIKMVVLDEADEMLNMGFIDDIKAILEQVPADHQTLLFSATMPGPIRELAGQFMRDPELIRILPKEITVSNIEQHYIEAQERQKYDVLCRLLDIHAPELAIVFGRTKRRVDELAEALNKRGYSAEGIHGDLAQAKRDSVLRRFREGAVEILVATDVAARGLDISGITHVYNFDIPQDPESYVHRIGRTGRAGKTGLAVTLVTSREQRHMKLIESSIKRKVTRQPIPTVNDVLEGQQQYTADKLLKTVEEGDTLLYRDMAIDMLERNDSVTLLAAALKLLTKEPVASSVILGGEAPLASNRPWKNKTGSAFSREKHVDYGKRRAGKGIKR